MIGRLVLPDDLSTKPGRPARLRLVKSFNDKPRKQAQDDMQTEAEHAT